MISLLIIQYALGEHSPIVLLNKHVTIVVDICLHFMIQVH